MRTGRGLVPWKVEYQRQVSTGETLRRPQFHVHHRFGFRRRNVAGLTLFRTMKHPLESRADLDAQYMPENAADGMPSTEPEAENGQLGSVSLLPAPGLPR